MIRRQFIRLITLLGLSSLFHQAGGTQKDAPHSLRFSVAGVRFHADAPIQPAGSRLEVRREFWNGEPALALFAADGRKIGFVPRKLVALLDGRIRQVHLVRSNPHALPWKRYLVEAGFS